MPDRRRRIVQAVFAVLALLVLKIVFTPVGRRGHEPHAVHGAYHVHSTHSDGRGTVEAIAEAARRDGLDFVVLTDHNILTPSEGGFHDGVLIVAATEESTAHGHVVSLGASRALSNEEKKPAAHALQRIRDVGGVPMLAHPYNRRTPFTEWADVGAAAGLETLSYDDLWREALRDPLRRGLVVGALELPFNPSLAVAQLIRRPAGQLMAYDALRKRYDLSQVCAVDAHGLPAYGPVFASMSMYLDDLPSGPLDARVVAERLEEGRAYCTLDVIGSGAGFGFVAEGNGVQISEGMSARFDGQTLLVTPPAPPLPRGAEAHLFKDGVDLGAVPFEVRRPAPGPGDYRVEIWAPLPGAFLEGPMVPWILSNSIRLQ